MATNGVGGVRWGTRDKQGQIARFLKEVYSGEPIHSYVGIAVDEPKRLIYKPNTSYPLAEWNMTEKDCLQYCYDHGYDWNEDGIELYSVLDRVSCWCCANKNLKELRNMWRYLPKYWNMLKGLQSRIDRPFKKNASIFELEERFKKEEAELLPFDKSSIWEPCRRLIWRKECAE